MEHRQAHRVSSDITVKLCTPDGVSCKGYIKNVSSLGAGIVLSEGALARGAMVKLQILSASRKQGVQSMGYVVRRNRNELGVLWATDDLAPMADDRQYYEERTSQQKSLMA